MTSNDLETALRSMVRRYGFVQVSRCLQEIGLSEGQFEHSGLHGDLSDGAVPAKSTTRRPKLSATEYVAKLDLHLGNKPIVVELAKRFESKGFLPTFGDIANFCQTNGLEAPKSKTRASAIPRIFKLMATMDSSRTQAILDTDMYSGPSKLGPIADAIRRNGRASKNALDLNVVKVGKGDAGLGPEQVDQCRRMA